MRKNEAEFLTKFISEIGTQKENNDYFGYVYLDNCAIWVVADGFDGETGAKIASKLAVESAVEYFMLTPEFSIEVLKEIVNYVNEVVRKKQNENENISIMHTSISIVISDYNSYLYANVGNTRLYHLREGYIINKSKDDTLSQVLAEEEIIGRDDIKIHRQRNDLLQAIGDYGDIKPNITTEPIKLQENDILCLITIGFWENITDSQLEIDFSRFSDRNELLNNFSKKIMTKDKTEIENYTIAVIDIKKTASDTIFKKNSVKKWGKILAGLLGIVFIIGMINVVVMYKKSKLLNEIVKYELIVNEEIIKKNFNNVNEYLKLEINNYNKIKKYGKGLIGILTNREKTVKIAEIGINETENKIRQVNDVEKIFKNINEGNLLFNNGNYTEAAEKYNESKYKLENITYKKDELNIENVIGSLNRRIESTQNLENAKQIEQMGDVAYSSGNYKTAKEKYSEVSNIYLLNDRVDYVSIIEKKINELNEKERMEYNGAISNENRGDVYFQTNFDISLESYNKAKKMYENLGDTGKVNEINEKIQDLNNRRAEEKLKEYIKENEIREKLEKLEIENNQILAEKEKEIQFEKEKLKIISEKFNEIESKMGEIENKITETNKKPKKKWWQFWK